MSLKPSYRDRSMPDAAIIGEASGRVLPDVSQMTHIKVDYVLSRVTPPHIGGGLGRSFGSHVDEIIGTALDRGERVATFTIAIAEDDWQVMANSVERQEDFAIKAE